MKTLKDFIIETYLDLGKFISNKYSDDPIKSAIYDYVAGLTTSISNELRNNCDYEPVSKLLDSAFKSRKYSKKSPIEVYRTIDWDYMNNMYGITPNNLKDKIGSTITNKGYMSTSCKCVSPWANFWSDYELILHITSKKSYPHIIINDIFDSSEIDCTDQNEYLLPRNTKLKLISFSIAKGKKYGYSSNGNYVIECEIV
jgi:hypothetical protein